MFTHFSETVNIKLLRSKWYFKPYSHAQSESSLASRWDRQPWYLKTRRTHLIIMVAADVLALFRHSISNHEPYWLDCDYIVSWTIFLHIYIYIYIYRNTVIKLTRYYTGVEYGYLMHGYCLFLVRSFSKSDSATPDDVTYIYTTTYYWYHIYGGENAGHIAAIKQYSARNDHATIPRVHNRKKICPLYEKFEASLVRFLSRLDSS